MKILHVMPSLSKSYGGPTQSWIGYAKAAETQGVDVAVAAPRVSKEDTDWLLSRVQGATFNFFRSAGKGATIRSSQLQKWLAHRGAHFDAIHVHGLFNPVSSFALRLCIKKQWPVVLRPFGTLSKYTFHHRRTWLKRRYFQYLDGPSLMKARGIHFTTHAEEAEAAWHGINFDRRSHVVPPPMHDMTRTFNTLACLNLRSDSLASSKSSAAPIVLFLSRLHPVKNLEALLDAWPLVQETMPQARLIIAGNGEAGYVQRLKERARSLGRARRIEFVGFVDGEKKSRLLAMSSVFVLPSYQENFGVAVMEAVSAGLPVVISPDVQLASYIEENKLGHVVTAEPESLAFSIVEILASQDFQLYCQNHGPAVIHRDYSLERVGQQLVSMYKSVIDHTS